MMAPENRRSRPDPSTQLCQARWIGNKGVQHIEHENQGESPYFFASFRIADNSKQPSTPSSMIPGMSSPGNIAG